MVNLTMHTFWLDFVPIAQHVNGVITTSLSALVMYLMVTKTPKAGKPLARYLILVQFAIFFMDFCWGFLFCPIFFIPLTATLCNGIICGSDVGMHIGMVLAFQGMIQVALSLTYTLHYKYTTIVKLTNRRQITSREKFVVRFSYWLLLELTVAFMAIMNDCRIDLHDYLVEEQFLLVEFVENHPNLRGVAYSIPRQPSIPTALGIMVLAGTVMVVGGCTYFVVQTLRMLGTNCKVTTMSERTRKMQQALMHTLVLQITVPTIIQIVPIFVILAACKFYWFSIDFVNAVLCSMLCHASVHTIFLIYTTPSYRAAVRFYSNRGNKDTVTSLNSIAKRTEPNLNKIETQLSVNR